MRYINMLQPPCGFIVQSKLAKVFILFINLGYKWENGGWGRGVESFDFKRKIINKYMKIVTQVAKNQEKVRRG